MTLHGDVAVIGAGPAGCSTALYLAKSGLSVILLDKARFPRPKPCGEGIMPSGLPILGELGVLADVETRGRHYLGIQFTGFNGKKAAGCFGDGRYGIAICREILDSILIQKAKSTPNIQVVESTKITKPLFENGKLSGWQLDSPLPQTGEGRVRAPHTFIADGSNSSMARMLGVKRTMPRRKRFGMRTHFQHIEGLGDLVEVYFLRGGEIYVAPQENGTALISVLLEEEAMAAFSGRTQAAFLEIISSCPALKTRMNRAVEISDIIGMGPLGGQAERWHGPGWTLVGDSAGSVDPITGEGISLALLNGKLAAEHFISKASEADYARGRTQLTRKKNRLAKLLLNASDKPWLCNFLIAWLAWRPSDFSAILSDC